MSIKAAVRANAPRRASLPRLSILALLGLVLSALAADPFAESLDRATIQAMAADLLDTGLVVNAVTPTALRLAPSLLVSDEEITEAVSLIGSALAAATERLEAQS